MQEIIEEFLVETYENLDRLDTLFVSLETEPSNVDILAGIFRDVHTIKGTSGFLGFSKLESVAHVGENLLSLLRDGELALNSRRTTVLLHMVDALREIITSIESTNDEGNGVYDPLVAELKQAATHEFDQELTEKIYSADDLPASEVQADEPTVEASEPAEEPSAPAEEPVVQETAVEELAAQEPVAEQAPVETQEETASTDDVDADDHSDDDDDYYSDDDDSDDEVYEENSTPAQPVATPAAQTPAAPAATEIPTMNASEANEPAQATKPAPAKPKRNPPPDRNHSAADSSIRVDVDLLDDLMNLVGELVLARNQILQYTSDADNSPLTDTSQRLNLITSELQEGVMKTRMQPIGNVFTKFPRVVRDIAAELGKQVEIVMEGRNTELDKTIIEAIKDPLTHMVRNSVDHGIETPEVRIQRGKNPTGTLTLRAFHEGGQVNIEIVDDGAGINPLKIKEKAIEKGILTQQQADLKSDRDLVNLVFNAGFSTAEKVSNISGRGVGMDVVRTSIENIGGSVEIFSEYGAGSTMRIKIPLTLAIIPALMIESAGERYAIPQVSLVELVRLDSHSKDIEMIHGTPVYRLRGRLLPLVYLDNLLGTADNNGTRTDRHEDSVNIVVLQAENHTFGLVVEVVNDTAEIVVKPLGEVLKDIPVYAGAMVMGDGVVALILDVLGVASEAGITGTAKELELMDEPVETGKKSEPLLIFQLGDDPESMMGRMAVPLRQVARLEEIDAERVEFASGRPVVQYRGKILPLVWLGDSLGLGANKQIQLLQVIVYERGNHQIGFIVDAISDVVDEVLEIQRPSEIMGIRGSAVIDGVVTDVLDVDAIIVREAPDLLSDSDAVSA